MNARMKGLTAGTLLASLLFSSGCVWAPELTAVKSDIARQLPEVGFRKNLTLSFGPLSMVLARTVTAFIPEAREVRGYLREVSRLQVAVYEVDGVHDGLDARTPAHLQELLEHGWELAVRVHEDGDRVWVLYRLDDESVREMFVVALSDEELVLVKIKGRLERIMAAALEDAHRGDGFLHGHRDMNL